MISLVFRRLNIGLLVCLGLFILFDKELLGVGIVLTALGTLSMFAFIYNTEPLGFSIGGFDYVMQKLLKEYYNRYFNLLWGSVQLICGVAALYKVFS
jgi:hypothetical protein